MQEIGSKHMVEIEQSEIIHTGYDSCFRRYYKVMVPCVVTGHDEMLVEYRTESDDCKLNGHRGATIPSNLLPLN